MNKILAVAAFAGAILSANVLAHGAKPKHGGIVQTAGDLSFELAARDGGAIIIHVDDHGKDKPTAGATGALTVLTGTRKTELPLESGGANILVVKGPAKLEKGSKAVATVNFADGKSVSVRFSVK